MKVYQYKDIRIEVSNECCYSFNSVDNKFLYSKIYYGDNTDGYITTKHGIKIYHNEDIIHDCLIAADGGATGIHDYSLLIDDENIVICCGNMLFRLSIPELNLNWCTKADDIVCFQIVKIEDDYLIHGEMSISRVDRCGNIKWQFYGADIFVSMDETTSAFVVSDYYIFLSDFGGKKYRLNFEGQCV